MYSSTSFCKSIRSKMRSRSTFLLKISLLCCVWCYCFGNNKQKSPRRKSSKEKKKHSSVKVATQFPDPGSSTKLSDSNMQGSSTSIHIENETKGYVNPDFYIPFIDSENDNSNSQSTLNKKKIDAQAVSKEKLFETAKSQIQPTSTPRHQEENKVYISVTKIQPEFKDNCNANVKTICNVEEIPSPDDDTDRSRSNCSSVKSSDFVVVLETARKNVEEIAKVRNSYYEKLAEAVFVPISVEDELVKETINFQVVTEELRRVGERYLIKDVRPSIESCQVQTDDMTEPLHDSATVIRKTDSPDSGLASGNEICRNLDKLIISSSDTNLTPTAAISPNQYNSKSSDCLKKLDINEESTPIKWRSVEEPKNFGRNDTEMNGLVVDGCRKRNSDPKDNQVVTTTVVQTGTTTLTQITKRFSGSWKEFELKTRRVVRSNSRTSNSSSDYTDDLKDLHVTVQSEQGDPKALVDETSRVVSQPHDSRVAAEYLTNLSHMLIDDCRKFHKDSRNGSEAPSECSEYSNELSIAKQCYKDDYTFESQESEARNFQKVDNYNYHSKNSKDDKTLSAVIASIAQSLASRDINGNEPANHQLQNTANHFEHEIQNMIEKPISSTLVISLHLSPNNLLEQDLESPPCKTTNQWFNGTEWVNFEDNISPLPETFIGDGMITKREKLVIIRDTYSKQESIDNHDMKLKPNDDVIMTKLETAQDDDSDLEDINIRRAREAVAFAQRYFQQGHKT